MYRPKQIFSDVARTPNAHNLSTFRQNPTSPEPGMRSRERGQYFATATAKTTRGLEVQQLRPLRRTEEHPPLPQQQGAHLRRYNIIKSYKGEREYLSQKVLLIVVEAVVVGVLAL